MLEKVAEDIGAGYSMAQSFENNMPGLPKTFIETVRAGEQSGALEECFKRLHRYYDKSAKTKTKVINTMTYRRIFDIAQLVDPGICVELTKTDEGYTLKKSEHCYAVWKKKRRCENCISQEVLRTHKPQTKIETRESDIYYVLASFIEVDGRPYSLELVKRIKSDDMFERENVLNQLLVRNRQVYMDSVTKVYNRRYYDERLKNLEGRFSFAMIDMDNFKHINDRFGHQAGDAALYRAAQAIKSQIRSDDELVRYGGDEFFLLFRDLPQQILEKKLQSIRAALDEIVIEEYPELHISASIGGDYGEAKARFQNDERIVRFLNMFPGDDSMQNLTNAMNAGDTTTAFRAVHTLKGVALNLGLGSLAHVSSQMTEALRGQDSMPESVQPLYEAVQKEHTAVRGALEQLEK